MMLCCQLLCHSAILCPYMTLQNRHREQSMMLCCQLLCHSAILCPYTKCQPWPSLALIRGTLKSKTARNGLLHPESDFIRENSIAWSWPRLEKGPSISASLSLSSLPQTHWSLLGCRLLWCLLRFRFQKLLFLLLVLVFLVRRSRVEVLHAPISFYFQFLGSFGGSPRSSAHRHSLLQMR